MLTDLRRERKEGCVSDLTFDEWRAGELTPDDVLKVDAHVRGCSECSARKRSFDTGAEAFLGGAPSFQPPNPAPKAMGAPRRSAGLLFGSAAAALALAAALVLLVRSPDGETTRAKGGTASLGFFVKRGDDVAPGADRESVRSGDVLRFTVSMVRPSHVAVFGLDARGVASVYYPPAGASHAFGPGRDIPLDVGVELDDAPGEERLYGLFCDAPADVSAVRRELERAGKLEPRRGCTIDVLRIEKDGKRWKWLAALFAMALALSPKSAHADVQRFAVLVGNNLGQGDDAPLRYAETDATKVQGVLRDLGGFVPANVVVLRNENATTVRSTLITLNDRIRTAAAVPGTQTLLFVYYSGHADASALHLGASRLDTFELAQLVRGSSATFRLLVVDACQSGALTRVKGGRIVAPFALPGQQGLGGEGLAFLTASSANEDAQESDELKGSFFTHALVSGLLGAADVDRDGAVTLEEAYRHAYGATLRATSRTWAGAQHPTFQYDFRGQDALVLTRLASAAAERATLSFPPDVAFLVLLANEEGPVVGEVGQGDRARSLSLRPGRYFLRGRGRDVLLEGEITLVTGETRSVDAGALRHVEYARLVRKGERESRVAHGPELGAALHSSLPGAETPCIGIVGGYRVELEHLTFDGRIGGCRSSFDNGVVRATTDELDASAAALHAWDLPWVTLALGVGAGGVLTFQAFETAGTAPNRQSVSPYVLAAGSATVDLPAGYFVSLDVRGETHFLDLQESSGSSSEVKPAVALRLALLGGLLF